MLLHWSHRDSLEGNFQFIFRWLRKEWFSRTKCTGEWIWHQSMKDTCATTFSTDQSLFTITHHRLRRSTWERTRTKRQWLHLIFWHLRWEKLWVDHRESRDWMYWRQSWTSWVFQRRITGGIWSWENSERFLMVVSVWDSRDWWWWRRASRISGMWRVSPELPETPNSDLWFYSYL